MQTILATWIYIAPRGSVSLHHQVGKDIGVQRVQDFYWRSLVCMMASASTHNPAARLLLFSNSREIPEVDGVSIESTLAELGVELVHLDHLTLPPAGYHGAWGTQFVVLDCMDKLVEMSQDDDVLMLLDSDCIFIKPVEPEMVAAIQKHQILRYTIDDGKVDAVNGLTWKNLADLGREYSPSVDRDHIKYAGGEIVAGTHGGLATAASLARSAYEQSLVRFSQNLQKFNEEAHLLSYVYEVMGIKDYTGNSFIKRIWTDRGVFCNVDGSEHSLVILHLPAEKKTGFKKAFLKYREDKLFFQKKTAIWSIFNIRPSVASFVRMGAYAIIRPLYHLLKR